MEPTNEQIVAEIESGPFAAELAPYWCVIFGPHPTKREALRYREGRLTPDAAAAIFGILADQSRRPLFIATIPRDELVMALATSMLSLHRADLPSERKQDWRMTFELLRSGVVTVDCRSPELRAILGDMVADGLMAVDTMTKLISGRMSTQSRLGELGWVGVSDHVISLAKQASVLASN